MPSIAQMHLSLAFLYFKHSLNGQASLESLSSMQAQLACFDTQIEKVTNENEKEDLLEKKQCLLHVIQFINLAQKDRLNEEEYQQCRQFYASNQEGRTVSKIPLEELLLTLESIDDLDQSVAGSLLYFVQGLLARGLKPTVNHLLEQYAQVDDKATQRGLLDEAMQAVTEKGVLTYDSIVMDTDRADLAKQIMDEKNNFYLNEITQLLTNEVIDSEALDRVIADLLEQLSALKILKGKIESPIKSLLNRFESEAKNRIAKAKDDAHLALPSEASGEQVCQAKAAQRGKAAFQLATLLSSLVKHQQSLLNLAKGKSKLSRFIKEKVENGADDCYDFHVDSFKQMTFVPELEGHQRLLEAVLFGYESIESQRPEKKQDLLASQYATQEVLADFLMWYTSQFEFLNYRSRNKKSLAEQAAGHYQSCMKFYEGDSSKDCRKMIFCLKLKKLLSSTSVKEFSQALEELSDNLNILGKDGDQERLMKIGVATLKQTVLHGIERIRMASLIAPSLYPQALEGEKKAIKTMEQVFNQTELKHVSEQPFLLITHLISKSYFFQSYVMMLRYFRAYSLSPKKLLECMLDGDSYLFDFYKLHCNAIIKGDMCNKEFIHLLFSMPEFNQVLIASNQEDIQKACAALKQKLASYSKQVVDEFLLSSTSICIGSIQQDDRLYPRYLELNGYRQYIKVWIHVLDKESPIATLLKARMHFVSSEFSEGFRLLSDLRQKGLFNYITMCFITLFQSYIQQGLSRFLSKENKFKEWKQENILPVNLKNWIPLWKQYIEHLQFELSKLECLKDGLRDLLRLETRLSVSKEQSRDEFKEKLERISSDLLAARNRLSKEQEALGNAMQASRPALAQQSIASAMSEPRQFSGFDGASVARTSDFSQPSAVRRQGGTQFGLERASSGNAMQASRSSFGPRHLAQAMSESSQRSGFGGASAARTSSFAVRRPESTQSRITQAPSAPSATLTVPVSQSSAPSATSAVPAPQSSVATAGQSNSGTRSVMLFAPSVSTASGQEPRVGAKRKRVAQGGDSDASKRRKKTLGEESSSSSARPQGPSVSVASGQEPQVGAKRKRVAQGGDSDASKRRKKTSGEESSSSSARPQGSSDSVSTLDALVDAADKAANGHGSPKHS